MMRRASWLLASAIMIAIALSATAQQPAPSQEAPSSALTQTASQPDQMLLKPEQLEALVAPVALYPDALLANMLAGPW